MRPNTAAVFLLAAVLAAPAAAAGDAERGARAFGTCAACHSVEPGRNLTGPSLAAVLGRRAGSLESFVRYSPALKKSGIVWDAKTLDRWLRDPQALVPGNSMAFPGIRDGDTRADLIAFLKAPTPKAGAHMAPSLPDLKTAPPKAVITALRHCGDTYFVTNAEGEMHPYWEFNLRFKTDSSPGGPAPGRPVLVRQGMRGDRAQLVFRSLQELAGFAREGC